MKIYISGISPEVSEKDLTELYSQFGKLIKVDLLKNPDTEENRGYAFIEFEDDMAAESAILGTNNTLLGGQNVAVSLSRSRLDQKRAGQQKNGRSPRVHNNTNRNFSNNPSDVPPREKRVFESRSNNQNNQFRERKNINNPLTSNTSFANKDGDSYNRFNNRNNQNSLQKGVDYGRKETYAPKMSFLGQEDFAGTPNNNNSYTPSPSNYGSNYRNTNRSKTNYRKSPRMDNRSNLVNNRNSFNHPNNPSPSASVDNTNVDSTNEDRYNHI